MDAIADYDIVTIQNISGEEFVFEFNRAAGTKPYRIPAGAVAHYPRFLADHAVSKLIDKILTSKNIRTNDRTERFKLAEKIILSEQVINAEPELSEGEKLNRKVEELNKSSELEGILGKRRGIVTPESLEPDSDEKYEDPEKATAEVTPVAPLKSLPDQQVNVPTREKLIDYAVNTLKMSLDPKTRAAFDKMSDEKLAQELDYHEEE